MKHLPKYLRPRWRYLGVGIESWPDADVDRGADVVSAVWARLSGHTTVVGS